MIRELEVACERCSGDGCVQCAYAGFYHVDQEIDDVYKVWRFPDHGPEEWRVDVNGATTSPQFNSKGAAEAYRDLLQRGDRKPEFS